MTRDTESGETEAMSQSIPNSLPDRPRGDSRRGPRALALALLVFAVGCVAPASAGEPPLEQGADAELQQQAGWTRVAGRDGTNCAPGTPFAFYVRPASVEKVMIYFQGGGACWDAATCDLFGTPTFDPILDPRDNPSNAVGILDLANPRNPVRDYTIVFVPYCTGDLFLGNRTVTYSTPRSNPPRAFSLRQVGAVNAAQAIEWVYSQVADPEIVFVAGGSAGAIPTPIFAARLASHYPDARVVQLGDGAGGYRSPAVARLIAQGPAIEVLREDSAYRAMDRASIDFEAFYAVSASKEPEVTFSQFNTADDTTQIAFLRRLGERSPLLREALRDNLSEVRAADPDFRSFTAPGRAHTILLRNQFYTLTVGDWSFRDWLTALLEGRSVPNVGDENLNPPPQGQLGE